MRRLLLLGFAAIAPAWLVVRCTTPEASLRYRMIVEVQTPDGPKSGASVQELVLLRQRLVPLPGAGGSDWGGGFAVAGEAPFVDLGQGKVLFTALHDARYSYGRMITSVALEAFGLSDFRRQQPEAGNADFLRGLETAKTLHVLRPEHYPMLATFAVTAEPKSLVELSSGAFADRFGPGYALSRITVQVVDQDTPLTAAVMQRFPALAAEQGLLTLPAS